MADSIGDQTPHPTNTANNHKQPHQESQPPTRKRTNTHLPTLSSHQQTTRRGSAKPLVKIPRSKTKRSQDHRMRREEFEKLAIEQMDAVYRMSLQLTRNQDKAADLVQEVFLRALKPTAVASFEDRRAGLNNGDESSAAASMRAWLFTITHNTFYSDLKRSRKAPTAVPDFFEETSTETPPDEPPPAWDLASFDWEHVDGRIKKAVEDLRPEYRQVLLMWGVQGLKYREIAEILEVPIGTVMSRLHRARKTLADELGGEDGAAADLGYKASADL